MEKNNAIIVGMDVHKETISVAVLAPGTGSRQSQDSRKAPTRERWEKKKEHEENF